MSAQARLPRAFGPFCLDEEQHLLTCKDQPVSLPPKCFDLLCLLVNNRGRLLEKDRLMQEIWPETFVEEANLSNTVALLRKALGDSPAASRYIQTVPKLGYRFVAPLRDLGTPGGQARGAEGHRPAIRILVFPFRSHAGFNDLEHLAYSLPEAISTTLAELNVFTVRSIQLAMRFDPFHWDPATVGREADVDVVLSGTLERTSAGIHAVTQLIEAPGGTLLWSKSWDVDANDLFRFHRGVVQLIVRTLVRGAGEKVWRPLPIDSPTSPEAYELYLRANQLSVQRTPQNIALARDLYIACVEKDASYAPAWARLGRCYRFLDKFGSETGRNGRSALSAIERAFALNPDLSIAHSVYTSIQADMGHAESAMIRLLRRAASHDNDPGLFSALVQACRYCGQLDASFAAHRRTLALDPNAHTSVAHTFFAKSDFEKALYWYGAGAGFYLDALALACMGRDQEASSLLWTRKDRFGLMPGPMNSLDAYLRGDRARCLAALEEAQRPDLLDPEVRYYLARQAARLGAIELATSLLLQSFEEGYWCTTGLRLDPWLESLRTTTQFCRIFEMVEKREAQSRAAFVNAGGERTLQEELHAGKDEYRPEQCVSKE
jgi:eukaryotic-like serine/threonine-protein kinase